MLSELSWTLSELSGSQLGRPVQNDEDGVLVVVKGTVQVNRALTKCTSID